MIQPLNNTVPFGYSHPLKTLYKRGKLPVKYGFYGGELTLETVSLEHLKCVSNGGKTELDNLVLATKENNNARSNSPLSSVINFEAAGKYLEQFKNLKKNGFDGNAYIQKILTTLGRLLKND